MTFQRLNFTNIRITASFGLNNILTSERVCFEADRNSCTLAADSHLKVGVAIYLIRLDREPQFQFVPMIQ